MINFIEIEDKGKWIGLINSNTVNRPLDPNNTDSFKLFALEENGRKLCFAATTIISEKTIELSKLMTPEKYRGHGYANIMMENLYSLYKFKYDEMLVGSCKKNLPFYIKQGFNNYVKTEDEILFYSKNLRKIRIKNIIFDLGNVIINWNSNYVVKYFTDDENEKKILLNIIGSDIWKQIDLGIIDTDEAISITKSSHDEKYHSLLENFWNNWFKIQPLMLDTMDIAYKLKKKGYNLYVLSNMGKSCYNYFKTLEFFKLFDGIVISANENIKKPDPKIFDLILNRYNLNPNETLLIDDDDTYQTITAANSAGINCRRVLPANTDDVKKLLKEFDVIF